MTNPSYKSVKIGYSQNPENRRKDLSKPSGIRDKFVLYAIYETPTNAADHNLHRIIDKLNPKLRHNRDREFYDMSPEDAYKLLEEIATISGTTNRLKKYSIHNMNDRRPYAKSGYSGSPNEPKRSKDPFEDCNPFKNCKDPFKDYNPFKRR